MTMSGPLTVAALGGNALMRRGEPRDSATQLGNVGAASDQPAKIARTCRQSVIGRLEDALALVDPSGMVGTRVTAAANRVRS